MPVSFEDSALCDFKAGTFRVLLSGCIPEHAEDKGSLSIVLVEEISKDTYHGVFSPSQIQDMTRKTGNYKRFSVFVEMLLSSIHKASDTVKLDILTSQDLAQIQEQSDADSEIHFDSKKLYLILTYVAAFDRVHYPLSLAFTENVQSLHQSSTVNTQDIVSSLIPTIQYEIHALRDDQKRQLEQIAQENRKEYCTNINDLLTVRLRYSQIKIENKLTKENDRLKFEMKKLESENRELTRIDEKTLRPRQVAEIYDATVRLDSAINGCYIDGYKKATMKKLVAKIQNLVGHSNEFRNFNSKKENSKPSSSRSQSASSSSFAKQNKRTPSQVSNKNVEPKYTIIKSKPLSLNSYTNNIQGRSSVYSTTSNKSAASSRSSSPFKRFDPTEYVRQKEIHLEAVQKRSLSRNRPTSTTPGTPGSKERRSTSIGSTSSSSRGAGNRNRQEFARQKSTFVNYNNRAHQSKNKNNVASSNSNKRTSSSPGKKRVAMNYGHRDKNDDNNIQQRLASLQNMLLSLQTDDI